MIEGQQKSRWFNIDNFMNAYSDGSMDIEDLIYVLF